MRLYTLVIDTNTGRLYRGLGSHPCTYRFSIEALDAASARMIGHGKLKNALKYKGMKLGAREVGIVKTTLTCDGPKYR